MSLPMTEQTKQIVLGNLKVYVTLKQIKNIHLSVHPPNGRVTISAPLRMDMDTIRVYAISRLSWIRKQQERFRSQHRELQRDFVTRESHYYLGKRYLLKIEETTDKQSVSIKQNHIVIHSRPGSGKNQHELLIQEWYRKQLKQLIPKYIDKWENKIDVKVSDFGIKKMKTKWGTCNQEAKRIWLNLELAKKPLECIEYIVVHEMIHLIEKTHNARFKALLNKHLPQWKHYKEELNRMPLGHTEWGE